MANKVPDHQDLERYVSELPLEVISRLPDNVERRRAEANIKIAYDLAIQSREKKADR